MEDVFIGAEALAEGVLTRGELRWHYRTVFPRVYMAKGAAPSFVHRIVAAWLWSRRQGVVAGVAAAAMHGARWVDESSDVELIWRCGRPPPGIVVRNERIEADEIVEIAGLPVTTPERTALDIARHDVREATVPRLDALARATGVAAGDVFAVGRSLRRHKRVAALNRGARLDGRRFTIAERSCGSAGPGRRGTSCAENRWTYGHWLQGADGRNRVRRQYIRFPHASGMDGDPCG